MSEWLAADLSQLDLRAIQIDGMQVTSELTLLAAIGIDDEGANHPLGLLEGATENAAVVQALLDSLIEREAGSEALPPVHHRWLEGADQGDPPHVRPAYAHSVLPGSQGTNIVERLPKHLHASVRAALRQSWELDDAEKAEHLIRNPARGWNRWRLVSQHPFWKVSTKC
jgi:putative transposase